MTSHSIRLLSRRLVFITCCLVLVALAGTAQAATRTWAGNDGTNPTFWDIGTTANWDAGAATYANGDNVNFTDAGVGTSVALQTTVSPASMSISANSNAYSFSGGDITGATSIIKNGNALATFSQNSLSFIGGTQINGSGDIAYNPASAGSHSFGTGAIQLNNTGAEFRFTPAVSGATLTNDFVINSNVTWDRSGNNGVRTGTATVNSNFTLRSDGVSGGVMDANMLLTGDRTISGSRFGGAFPVISGNVNSSGGARNITISTNGDNTDWHLDVTSPTGWNVKDIIHDAAGAQRATLLFLVGNESTFFSTMDANGGQLRLLRGGTKVGSDNTINLTFDMVVNAPHRGFIDNNLINISGGGNLYGTGTLASKAGIGNDLNTIYQSNMNVNVNAGGTIAPGDPQGLTSIGKLTVDGNVTFNGGQLAIEINGANTAGTDYDQLVVSDIPAGGGTYGKVSGLENATLVLDFDPSMTFSQLSGKTLTILTSNGLLSTQFGSVIDNFNPGVGTFSYDVLFQGNQILITNFQLTLPEPGAGLLVLGMLGLVVRRRRKSDRMTV